MRKMKEFCYNERLFSGVIRKRLHYARFLWFIDRLNKLNIQPNSILELGCYDGKLLDFIDKKPEIYYGLDANWEGGLDIAKEKLKDYEQYHVQYCINADMINMSRDFDIAVSMETLEHINDFYEVDRYLDKISQITKRYLFVTVPNEKYIIFAAKYLIKKILGDIDKYSTIEFINATLGRMERIERNQHKGFDYLKLIKSMTKYFKIIEVSGHPISFLPAYLNFGVGIIGAKRPITRG